MPVTVVIREYLNKLQEQENQKPASERRSIPTVREMAAAADLSKTGFINFTQNRTNSIRRHVVDSIITQLRERGFDTDINDLVVYQAPDEK